MTDGTEGKKPTTLAEAVETLRSKYPKDELASWAAEPLSEALCKAHFQAGLWIRNEWVHEQPAPLVRRMRELAYFVHDDDASQVILEALWRVVNGQECPTIEDLFAKRFPGRLKEPTSSAEMSEEMDTV